MSAIWSKMLMTDYSLAYNCYELGHTWTPSCTKACTDVGYFVFVNSLKMYGGLYFTAHLFSKRRFQLKATIETCKSVLRSASFLSFNAFAVIAAFCCTRRLVGKFYIPIVGHVPAIVASMMAIYMERPSRRSTLAFYVTNVASESVYKLLLAKGIVKNVFHGEVMLFTLTMSLLMYLIKKNGYGNDLLSHVLRAILGDEEAKPKCKRHVASGVSSATEIDDANIISARSENDRRLYQKIIELLFGNKWSLKWLTERMPFSTAITFLLNRKHECCPHNDTSCFIYVTKTFFRSFLSGYLVHTLALAVKRADRFPAVLIEKLRDRKCVNFGLFLATFSSAFKFINCSLRWMNGVDQHWYSSVAGFVASFGMLFSPHSTIAQHLFWKCVETVYYVAVRDGYLSPSAHLINMVYAVSCAQLFYVAVLCPSFMRKSYMKFMLRMTNNYLALMNRNIIDTIGTHSSSGFRYTDPTLQFEHTSRKYREAVLIWFH